MNPQDRIHLPQDEDRLLEYLDDQLPATEARAIETHLAACPECQALRRQWEQLDEKLARTLAQPRLSPDFAARLREQVAPGARAAVRVRKGGERGASTHEPWIEARRRATRISWLGLLDGLGYGAAAAVGGYWLFHLAVAWVPGHAGTGTAFLRDPAFLLALATAGAALLVGLNLAAKNRIWRWLGAV
ncbi:MAG: anti-sigma factor family protein [Limisphaerales bacterium]